MTAGGQGHPIYLTLLEQRVELHLEKSSGYGTAEDPFANFTGVARAKGQPRFIYPIDRIQEKLVRVYSLLEQGRTAEIPQELGDIASLADCSHSMLLEDEGEGHAGQGSQG